MKNKTNSDKDVVNGGAAVHTGKSIESTQWTKYHNEKGGGGFAAEDANALSDQMRGRKVEKTGITNEKDGSDRVVHYRGGKVREIQTKYYRTPKETVNAAFDRETGSYRYGKQLLEVPKDQYDEAVKEFALKIRDGKVPGVTDPDKAKDIVKQGDVTYIQARNIAKAGNIDSLKLDVKSQSVSTVCVFGMSFVISFASCKWNGMDNSQALRFSAVNAIKSGVSVMVSGVIVRQLLRTQIGRDFAACTTRYAKSVINEIYKTEIGKTAIHKLASAIAGKALYGAAAKNVVTKLARTSWPVTICMTAATALPDLYKAAIKQNISWKQFTKNLAVNVAGALGGAGGALVGAATGAAIGSAFPGPGTVIGGVVGGLVGGLGGGMGSSKLADWLSHMVCENDSEEMQKIIQEVVPQLASDYLVSEDEFNAISKKFKEVIDAKWLQDMYHAGVKGREKTDKVALRADYAYTKLSLLFEEEISKRPLVTMPNDSEIRRDIKKINRIMLFEYIKSLILNFLMIKRFAILEE